MYEIEFYDAFDNVIDSRMCDPKNNAINAFVNKIKDQNPEIIRWQVVGTDEVEIVDEKEE